MRRRARRHSSNASRSCVGRSVRCWSAPTAWPSRRRCRKRCSAAGIAHRVLNALHDADEAAIVAEAGRARQVTVATRMAGRGTDIELDAAAHAAGGLHVLSCQANPSRRLDRQLAGRAARHGDNGSAEVWRIDPFCHAGNAGRCQLRSLHGSATPATSTLTTARRTPARRLAARIAAAGSALGTAPVFCGTGALILALMMLPADAAPNKNAAPPQAFNAAKSLGCLIEPDRVADVGSQVVGIVDRLKVERGQSVKAGQPLITLRAEVERANAGVAQTRARVDAEIRAAEASLKLGEQKLRRAKDLQSDNFVSEQAVEQARTEHEVARQRLEQARAQQRLWGEERRVAEAQLALRTVRSPFAGVVVERFVNDGERVEEKPLLRIAVVDPLRVELMVPTAQYGSVAVGERITIHPELPGAAPVVATVRHVDGVLDAASNSFRVRLSLPNPNRRLPAGLRCKADLPSAAAAPASAADAAGPIARSRY